MERVAAYQGWPLRGVPHALCEHTGLETKTQRNGHHSYSPNSKMIISLGVQAQIKLSAYL